MADDLVQTSVDGAVAHLRLNRPDKRNAMNAGVSHGVIAAMAAFDADDAVRVIVVEGADGAFSAGADMAEAMEHYEAGEHRFNPSAEAAERVGATPKPTIAKIDGPAYGAGALLACACDLRVLSDRSRFRFPGADYGLVVGAAGLTALVGAALAKELIFTSRVVDAEEAARIGLANRVVPPEELDAVVEELTSAIAAASPLAVSWAKQAIDATIGAGDGLGVEAQADRLLRGGADHMDRFSRATQRVTGRGAAGRGSNQ
jgi:enoyl-CoA hydratase